MLLKLTAPLVAALAVTGTASLQSAFAQANIPEPPNLINTSRIPEPPPIGDGLWTPKADVIGGDALDSKRPSVTNALDGADKGTGVHHRDFGTAIGRDRTVAYLHRTANQQRDIAHRQQTLGSMVTIRPDQLSARQLAAIQGILGVNLLSGQQAVDPVQPSDTQLEQIQQVLAPYPKLDGLNAYDWNKKTSIASGQNWREISIPRKQLNMNAAPDPTYYPKPGEENIYDFQGPLPTVRKLSRLFVLVGVVSATIFLAFAAYSVVLGHREGGSRVVGAAGGLLVLLSAYTIWKIVIVNSFALRGMPNPRLDTALFNRPQTAPVSDTNMAAPGLPVRPVPAINPLVRSGIPVVPASGQ